MSDVASRRDLYYGKAEMTAMEIMDSANRGGEQAVLALAKEKGAPIIGVNGLLEQDPTYKWTVTLAPDRMSQTVVWKKILPTKLQIE